MAGDTIDRIKDRVDIVDLISSRVPLRQAGRNFKGLCPFHQEKTPSFVVFPESQRYHCFGCGKSGDIFTFLMDTENLEFPDAMRQLAERAGVELRPSSPSNAALDEHRDRLQELTEIAATYYANVLWSPRSGEAAREVLEQRGVDRQTAEQFTLGYAPDAWDSLKVHLQKRTGATEDLLVEAGLCIRSDTGRVYDRFRNRLMFPIRDRRGKAIGFGARAMGDEMPKYLNSPQTPIFNKSAALYAIDRAMPEIRRTRTLIVVEGYMDAIAGHQFGYSNVVASMGTALTAQQVQAIRRYVDRVYIALDSDAAGQLATLRAVDTMRESFADEEVFRTDPEMMFRIERAIGAEISIVVLNEGKDPDELIRSDRELWDQSLTEAIPLARYVLTARLSDVEPTPSARATALREIAIPVLREIKDRAIQRDYIDLTARLLNYPERDIESALRPARRATTVEVRSLQRPTPTDPERLLVRLLLTYPLGVAIRQGTLDAIDTGLLTDARNRIIVTTLMDCSWDVDAALEELPEEIADYAEEVRAATEVRSDLSPSMASREIAEAIDAIARRWYQEQVQQAQADIRAAKESNDLAALAAAVQHMNELAQLKSQFAPRHSPYFKDLRSPLS